MFVIEGKIALITGGAAGIGLSIAKELLKNGLKGVTLAEVNEQSGHNALKEIEEEFGPNRAIFVKTDVSHKAQLEEAFKATVRNFKHVDILINNAGIFDEINWERMILINLNGTINGSLLGLDHYIPKYRSGTEGLIINLASIAGLDPFGAAPIYSTTKHAIVGLTRSLGKEAHYNITKVKVIALCPGVTDTPLIDLSEPAKKILGPRYIEMVPGELSPLATQSPAFVAESLIDVIKRGESGSAWVIEGKQAAYEIGFASREERAIC